MIRSLISMYDKGAITADHLVLECIHMIDPDDPGMVLNELPRPLLARMLTFARDYRPNDMKSTYGLPPAADQVEAARGWIEDLQSVRAEEKISTKADK